jgi:hypothetical protein
MRKENFPVSKMSVQWTLDSKSKANPLSEQGGFEIIENLQTGENFFLKANYGLTEAHAPITLGTQVKFLHRGEFQCVSCSKSVKKLFEGYCFPCFRGRAQADRCVMNPHLCHYRNGTCREPAWGEDFCFKPHFLYLSYTDKIKVGITRQNQVPTRWFDQGATMAMAIARVSSRYQAGVLENFLTTVIADKSNWQRMIKSANNRMSADEFRLEAIKARKFICESKEFNEGTLHVELPQKLNLLRELEFFENPSLFELEYPIESVPEKFGSLGLEKTAEVSGKVRGIKGQYLIFENAVFNVRKHEGFMIDFESEN